LNGFGAAFFVARHKRLGLFREVEKDRPALKEAEISSLEDRHLLERLHLAMQARLLLEWDRLDIIGDASFVRRPSHADVPHKATREFRHPIIGDDGYGLGHVLSSIQVCSRL